MQRNGKLVAVSAVVTGALAVSGVGVGVGVAASSAKTHTLKFTAKTTSQKFFGKEFVESDTDVQKGKVIGYDVSNGAYHSTSKTVSVDITVALKGGSISGYAVDDTTTGKATGKITGGSGKYKGVRGSITGQATGKNDQNTNIVLAYH